MRWFKLSNVSLISNRYLQFITLMLFLAHFESNFKTFENFRYFVIIFNHCFDFQAENDHCIETLRHVKDQLPRSKWMVQKDKVCQKPSHLRKPLQRFYRITNFHIRNYVIGVFPATRLQQTSRPIAGLCLKPRFIGNARVRLDIRSHKLKLMINYLLGKLLNKSC